MCALIYMCMCARMLVCEGEYVCRREGVSGCQWIGLVVYRYV